MSIQTVLALQISEQFEVLLGPGFTYVVVFFFYCAAVTWLRLNGKLYGIFIRNIRVKILQTENASRKGNKIYKQHLSIYKCIALTIYRIYNSRTVYLFCIFRKQ